ADLDASRLKPGERGEAAGIVAELAVLLIGKQRPVILKTAVDAAVLVIADADQFSGARDGQGPEQNGVDEREDGGGGADAEGEGENGGDGEAGGPEKLADCVADVVEQRQGRNSPWD